MRAVIAEHFTVGVRDEVNRTGTIHSWALHRAMGERGWIREALPEAQGGGGRDPEELAGLFAELELAGAPYDGLSNVVMVSSVLAHVGNDMVQAARCCRACCRVKPLVCLGYSEPDSGSDVAAARTRAVRDGDGWRIDGQKMFTSVAEESEWIFLLTRTSADGAKHAGLTFFLVPMSTPGISLQEVRTLPGKRVNITFLDGVHIGDEWRVGDVDGGWQVMLVALSFERGLAGGVRDAERTLRVVEEWAYRTDADGTAADRRRGRTRATGRASRSRPRSPTCSPGAPRGSRRREACQAPRARRRGCSPANRSRAPRAGPSTSPGPKDWSAATGPPGDLAGFFEQCYRLAPGTTLAGGTTEIQRNLIAQRGLGLPRGR